MRITNNMLTKAQLDGLTANIAALTKAQAQVSSGHRLQQASDDPTAATQIMASGSALRSLDQYKTNVQRASTRIDTEDSVLQQVTDVLTRIKELGMMNGGDVGTPQNRQIAAAEGKELFNQLITLGNTRFGGEYLFGGDQSTTQPFTSTTTGGFIDYTTTAATGSRAVQIGDGQSLQIAHDGSQLFVNTGVLSAVKDMVLALDPTSPTYGTANINAALTSVDNAMDSVQTVVGEVGARGRQLDSASQNLDAYKTNVTVMKSNLEDVDLETAITELTSRQTAYQAALLSTSKVTGLTLTDYLR